MNPDNQAINNLLEALNFSPNNVPLRLHVAQLLIQAKRFAEAEEQLKKVLGIDANHLQAKQNLAKVFLLQGKHTTAFVIVEDLLSMGTPPPSVYLL
ncbi:MAG: tetratricopeptide repeat protein, partial [Chitinophagales bacterium]